MRIELVNGGVFLEGREIFGNINVSLSEGDLTVITGEESSGKSILFDVLRLKRQLDSGNILIDNKDPYENPGVESFYGSLLGLVPEPGTYPLDMSIHTLLKANWEVASGIKRREYGRRLEEGRKFFRLQFEDAMKLGELSRSERTRFLLLLEMVRDPMVLILDSVLSEAGEFWGERVFLFSRKICEDGRIIVILERALPGYLEKRATKRVEGAGRFTFYTFYRKEEVII